MLKSLKKQKNRVNKKSRKVFISILLFLCLGFVFPFTKSDKNLLVKIGGDEILCNLPEFYLPGFNHRCFVQLSEFFFVVNLSSDTIFIKKNKNIKSEINKNNLCIRLNYAYEHGRMILPKDTTIIEFYSDTLFSFVYNPKNLKENLYSKVDSILHNSSSSVSFDFTKGNKELHFTMEKIGKIKGYTTSVIKP